MCGGGLGAGGAPEGMLLHTGMHLCSMLDLPVVWFGFSFLTLLTSV